MFVYLSDSLSLTVQELQGNKFEKTLKEGL
jgi:hypothetical protein